MQTLIIPQIGKFMKNKNIFLHKVIEETTGLLLVTVQEKGESMKDEVSSFSVQSRAKVMSSLQLRYEEKDSYFS